jgi:hypothetical protein
MSDDRPVMNDIVAADGRPRADHGICHYFCAAADAGMISDDHVRSYFRVVRNQG